ncbi:MAG: FRG domain-containing protein [Muribaculum sp.]|nr:FRG domain-containing protein [Muribaculum sp.]
MNYKIIPYNSWQDFKRDYCIDLFPDRSFIPKMYIFRGQANANWDLVSSFDRVYSSLNWQMRARVEQELIEQFCNNCSQYVFNCPPFPNDFDKKSMAQHYGVPTRLLDWSYSPFIAAYFAFSSIAKNPSDYIAIWALKREHEIWNSNRGVFIHEQITQENEHQKHQLGCFSILNNQAKSVNDFVDSCANEGIDVEGALTKIVLPASEFISALYELDAMNINASTIWGGYEGCARAATDIIACKYL